VNGLLPRPQPRQCPPRREPVPVDVRLIAGL
jgi:hypothetical protein